MNLSLYQEHFSLSHRLKRYGWYVINRTLFRMMATNAMKVPRNLLLRLFGAKHAAGDRCRGGTGRHGSRCYRCYRCGTGA